MEKPVLRALRLNRWVYRLGSGRDAFRKKVKTMKYMFPIPCLSAVIPDMYLLFWRRPEQRLLSDHLSDGPWPAGKHNLKFAHGANVFPTDDCAVKSKRRTCSITNHPSRAMSKATTVGSVRAPSAAC